MPKVWRVWPSPTVVLLSACSPLFPLRARLLAVKPHTLLANLPGRRMASLTQANHVTNLGRHFWVPRCTEFDLFEHSIRGSAEMHCLEGVVARIR